MNKTKIHYNTRHNKSLLYVINMHPNENMELIKKGIKDFL